MVQIFSSLIKQTYYAAVDKWFHYTIVHECHIVPKLGSGFGRQSLGIPVFNGCKWDGISGGAKSWVVNGCKRFHPYQVALVLLHKLLKKFHSSWARLVTLVHYNAIHIFWQANWPMDLNLPRKNNHATVSILHMLMWLAYLQIQHRYICIK